MTVSNLSLNFNFKDRDHLNTILQICGTPDEEMMSKIDSEDVSCFFYVCHVLYLCCAGPYIY